MAKKLMDLGAQKRMQTTELVLPQGHGDPVRDSGRCVVPLLIMVVRGNAEGVA